MEDARTAGAVHAVFVSDQREPPAELQEYFLVRRLSFADAEPALGGVDREVVVVDAVDRPRVPEVSRLALGGTRGVIVIGPRRDGPEATQYLDVGACDYVGSAVSPLELAARMRTVARSLGPEHRDDTVTCGPLRLSARRREVRRDGVLIHLTPNEFAILEYLARSPGHVFKHRELMSHVWGPEFADARHYLRLYIRQLREKLELDPAAPELIRTERGVGYRLVAATDDQAASA